MSNLAIWDALGRTDPAHTKAFTRGGGFRGTAIKPVYTELKMTELFGPCGTGWGYTEPQFQLVNGPEGEVAVYCWLSLWYRRSDGERSELIPGVGGDFVARKNKYGIQTDDEAFKKAATDALGNAMKHLGMSADVHMGRFDDSKYVNEMREEAANGNGPTRTAPPKRTMAEISANKVRKEKGLEGVVQDLAQIESLPELHRYKREHLTDEFMASMGTVQFHIEEHYAKREVELSAPVDDEPEIQPPAAGQPATRAEYIQQCHEIIAAEKEPNKLRGWWTGESMARRRFSVSQAEVDDLKARVAARLRELGAIRDKGGREMSVLEAL